MYPATGATRRELRAPPEGYNVAAMESQNIEKEGPATLTAPQAGELAGVTKMTVALWARHGRIPYTWGETPDGNRCRMFRREDVLAIMAEREANGGRLTPAEAY